MKTKIYIIVILGLLLICIGVNYDFITEFLGIEKKTEAQTSEKNTDTKAEPEKASEEATPKEISLIDFNTYQTDVKRYYTEKETNKEQSYLVIDASETNITIVEMIEGMNIEEIPKENQKTYEYSQDIKSYYYDKTTDQTTLADTAEIKNLLQAGTNKAYIELSENKVSQIVIYKN